MSDDNEEIRIATFLTRDDAREVIGVCIAAVREADATGARASFGMDPQPDGSVVLFGTRDVALAVAHFLITNDMLDDEEECQYCHGTPCFWTQRQHDINPFIDMLHDEEGITNRERRFRAYRFISRLYEGFLGRGVRRQLPQCLETEVRDCFPKRPDEDYVGFQSSDNNVNNEV